jgi:hypothetical protein
MAHLDTRLGRLLYSIRDGTEPISISSEFALADPLISRFTPGGYRPENEDPLLNALSSEYSASLFIVPKCSIIHDPPKL